MNEITCPYCKTTKEYNFERVEQGEIINIQCSCCDKYFQCETIITVDYYPKKADCLNDGNHDYQPTNTFPEQFRKMRCKTCGDEIGFTLEESIEHRFSDMGYTDA
jgi:hypothetical protein